MNSNNKNDYEQNSCSYCGLSFAGIGCNKGNIKKHLNKHIVPGVQKLTNFWNKTTGIFKKLFNLNFKKIN